MGRVKHLEKWERIEIETCLRRGCSITEISKQINRSKSCVSKEIRLNTDPVTGRYSCERAETLHRERQYQGKSGTILLLGRRVKMCNNK